MKTPKTGLREEIKEKMNKIFYDDNKSKLYETLKNKLHLEENLNELNLSLENCKLLETIPMLYQGWECDEWAWLVKDPTGQLFILETSHGSPSKTEGVKNIENFIKRNGVRYQQALDSLARCRKLAIATKKNTSKSKKPKS